jgi:hypothetical protein
MIDLPRVLRFISFSFPFLRGGVQYAAFIVFIILVCAGASLPSGVAGVSI